MIVRKLTVGFLNAQMINCHAVVDVENERELAELVAPGATDDSTLFAIRLDDGTLHVRRSSIQLVHIGWPEELPAKSNAIGLGH